MSNALRLRLKLKVLSESLALGRFSSIEKSLAGFEPEEVRPLKPGDSPASSSFDFLRSILYRRYFLRVRRAEKSARVVMCLDNSPSMTIGLRQTTKDFVINICEEIVEGLSEGFAEVGFISWSLEIEDVFPLLGGVSRARERLAFIKEKENEYSLTRPKSLFEYLLMAGGKPSLVFVFSDWHDTGDFSDSLRQCLAAKLDIVPVVVRDRLDAGMPRFLGDTNFKSSESGTVKTLTKISGEAEGVKIFLSVGLPFITISSDDEDDEWRKSFIEFFELRERERR